MKRPRAAGSSLSDSDVGLDRCLLSRDFLDDTGQGCFELVQLEDRAAICIRNICFRILNPGRNEQCQCGELLIVS